MVIENNFKIELSLVDGVCQNNCVWCFKNKIEKRIIDLDKFFTFIDNNVFERTPIITMSLGETLDHPNVVDFFTYIKDNENLYIPQFNTSLYTNNFDKKVESMLVCNNIVIEMGGVSEESRMNNMGTPIQPFINNLNLLHETVTEGTNIIVKMMLNKNNYKEFDEFMLLSNKYPKFKFMPSSVQVFREEFFKGVMNSSNPKVDRQIFIKNNFNEEFPIANSTEDTPIFGDHIIKAWFIGADNKVYMCFVSSLLGSKYSVGDSDTFNIKEFEQTDTYNNKMEIIRIRKHTPVCSVYCNI